MTRQELSSYLQGTELAVRRDSLTSIGKPGVTDEQLARGHRWRGLKSIAVHQAPLVTGSFLGAYAESQVERVYLFGVPIGDAACHHLANLKHLTDLIVRGCRISAQGLRALAQAPRLETCELTTLHAFLDPRAIAAFEGHTQIKHLSLEGPGLSAPTRSGALLARMQGAFWLSVAKCLGQTGFAPIEIGVAPDLVKFF